MIELVKLQISPLKYFIFFTELLYGVGYICLFSIESRHINLVKFYLVRLFISNIYRLHLSKKQNYMFYELLQYVLQDHNYGAPPPPTPSSPPKPIVNGVSTANGLARSLPPANQQTPLNNFVAIRTTKNVQQPSTPSIFSSSKLNLFIFITNVFYHVAHFVLLANISASFLLVYHDNSINIYNDNNIDLIH